MTYLDDLNARIAAKKTESMTSLEKLGNAITTSMVSNTTAVFKELVAKELVSKACVGSACGKVCPNCGKVHPEDQGDSEPKASAQPKDNANGSSGASNDDPNNQAQPQITTASSMVQSMGSALKHPVQVNHDAAGVGVTHAVMTVHPEWNHDSVKSKIDSHLKTQGWKSGKGHSGAAGSKTYESPEGHKIHVAPVGKHLIVSGDDKKGSSPTPYTAPQKPVKKSGDTILDTFEECIAKTVATVNGALALNDSNETN